MKFSSIKGLDNIMYKIKWRGTEDLFEYFRSCSYVTEVPSCNIIKWGSQQLTQEVNFYQNSSESNLTFLMDWYILPRGDEGKILTYNRGL